MDADNRLGAGDLVSYKGDLYYAKPNGSRACYLYLTPEDCKNDTNRQYSPSPRSVKIIKRQDHLARRSRKQGDNKSVRKITWPEEAASKATTDLSSSSSSSSAPSSASTVPSSPVPLRVNVPTLPPLDELALQLLDGPTFDHQQLILFGHLDGPGFNRWNDVDLVTIYFAGRNDSRGFPGVNDEPRSTGAEDYKLCLREGPFSVVNPRALLTEVLHGPCPEIYDVEYAYEQKLAHARLTLALLWKAIASLKVVRCCTLEGARLLVEACFGPEAAAAGKEASSRLEAGTQVVLNFGGREVPMVVQHHPAYHLKHGRGHHPTEKQNTRCVRELLARGTRQPLTRGSWEQYLRRARAAETWTSRYSQRPTKPRPPTGKDKGPEPVSDETEGDAETRDAHNFADEVLWWQQEMNSVEEQLEKLTMAKKHETSSLVEQVRQITREKEKLLRTVSGLEAEVKKLTKLKEEREWVIDHQKAELRKWENNLGQLCRNVGFRPDDRRAPTRREKMRKGKKKMKNEKGGESEAEEEEEEA